MTILHRVARFALRGAFIGGVIGVFAAVVIRVRHVAPAIGMSTVSLVLLYPLFGALTGGIIGCFQPMIRTRLQGAIVAAIALWPAAVAALAVSQGPINEWGYWEWSATLLGSALFGVIGVWQFWDLWN